MNNEFWKCLKKQTNFFCGVREKTNKMQQLDVYF